MKVRIFLVFGKIVVLTIVYLLHEERHNTGNFIYHKYPNQPTYTIAMTDTTFDDDTVFMDGFSDDNALIKITEDGTGCTQLQSV